MLFLIGFNYADFFIYRITYEKGGINAGLVVTTNEGEPLTLKHRLTHHFTTAMSTIEISSANATRLVDEFEKYFKENLNAPAAPYKSYIIRADNHPDKLKKLTTWLASHHIQFGHGVAKPLRGFDYQAQSVNAFSLSSDDIVINIYQPKGRLVTTLFEPSSRLTDSLTYDITAWNVIYSYDLKAYANGTTIGWISISIAWIIQVKALFGKVEPALLIKIFRVVLTN